MQAITQVLQTSPGMMSLQHSVGVKGQDPLADQKAVQMKSQSASQDHLLSRMQCADTDQKFPSLGYKIRLHILPPKPSFTSWFCLSGVMFRFRQGRCCSVHGI